MPIDLESLFAQLTNIYYNHTIPTIAAGVVLFLLICFRPKALLKTAGIVLALAVAVYGFMLAMDMTGTGRSQKHEMIHKVE